MEACLLMRTRALVRPNLIDGRGDLLVLRRGFLSLSSLGKFLLGLISQVHQGFISVEIFVTHAATDLGLQVLDNYSQLLFLRDYVDHLMVTLGQAILFQSVQLQGSDIGSEVHVRWSIPREFLNVREFEINQQTGIWYGNGPIRFGLIDYNLRALKRLVMFGIQPGGFGILHWWYIDVGKGHRRWTVDAGRMCWELFGGATGPRAWLPSTGFGFGLGWFVSTDVLAMIRASRWAWVATWFRIPLVWLGLAIYPKGEYVQGPFDIRFGIIITTRNKEVLRALESTTEEVGDDDILGMHDQLRDLGRHIACEGKLDEWGRWSRLWDWDKAFEFYKTGQGTEKVKALCLDLHPSKFPRVWEYSDDWCVSKYTNLRLLEGEKFLRLPHIRYLTLDALDILYGDFEHCLPNLRWLQWRNCSLKSIMPTNLHLRNLVILDLSFGSITEDSDLWNQIQMSKKLKVLDLSWCVYLRRVPFLSKFSNLERLVVNDCGLYTLDGVEELEALRYLDASYCYSLKTLPSLSRKSIWSDELKKVEKIELSMLSQANRDSWTRGIGIFEMFGHG
ncbi:hypothetical protein LguiB_013484 [Lonicera macranthoides]